MKPSKKARHEAGMAIPTDWARPPATSAVCNLGSLKRLCMSVAATLRRMHVCIRIAAGSDRKQKESLNSPHTGLLALKFFHIFGLY
jgi:hypothetical protein